ncbi:glycosyltransferase family 4 protein [Winogradskyella sp.]|uniref:glycosyltransferase family 4 protein n=1 Tax=Winogradskyella sp. TaxID=1883156 RepID=UPI003AB7F453
MKKKVLILSVPPPYGGGEIRAKQLSNHFAGYSDFVIIENTNKSKNKANQGKILLSNVIINVQYIVRNVWTILKVRPSLVYLSIPKNFLPLLKILPVLVTSKLVKSKVVGELAGRNFYFLERKGLSYQLGLRILKKFDSIRVLGKSVDATLKSHGLIRNVVIDNGVAIPKQEENKLKSLSKVPLVIGFVGALHKNKGIFILIEIAKQLKESNINFTLQIAGEWGNNEDKIKVENFIDQNKLTANVKFLGLIHDEEKWEFYKNTDIFVLPSYNEGQPLVLIEAMAYGIPVVCSGVGAIPDTVTSGYNGFIVEEFSAVKYANKIKYLLKDTIQYQKISSNNLDTFGKKFQVQDYLNNIHNWIDNNS